MGGMYMGGVYGGCIGGMYMGGCLGGIHGGVYMGGCIWGGCIWGDVYGGCIWGYLTNPHLLEGGGEYEGATPCDPWVLGGLGMDVGVV